MSNAPAEELPTEEIDLAAANYIIDKYLTLPGNLMPVLQGIQEEYGYVPRPAIDLVAERLNVYPSQIYGVLTFYAQFHLKPRGRFIIRVGVGTACHVQGADSLDTVVEQRLGVKPGATTGDGEFTVERVACLGCCSLAPVVMIDGEVYGRLTGDKLGKIVSAASAAKSPAPGTARP